MQGYANYFFTLLNYTMTQEELEVMHLKVFLEKRGLPRNILEAVYSNPLAPKLLIDAFFSVQVFGEREGMRINFASHDLNESKKAFIDFISA
jgi:hypothetical protein